METVFQTVYRITGGDEFMMSVIVTPALALVFFWIMNTPFMLVDLLQPAWAQAYRIQDTKPVSWDRYQTAIKRAILNTTIYTAPAFFLYTYLPDRFTPFGLSYSRTLPSWITVMWQLFLCTLIEEVGAYYTHRLSHHPRIYKYIHKMHHEWKTPVSISSIYVHPLEHIFFNLPSILLGPTLLGAHITTMWLWYALFLFTTAIDHSGYKVPIQPPSEFHDYHHSMFNENFGAIGILDTLHGTNTSFLKTKQGRNFHIGLTKTEVFMLFVVIKVLF